MCKLLELNLNNNVDILLHNFYLVLHDFHHQHENKINRMILVFEDFYAGLHSKRSCIYYLT